MSVGARAVAAARGVVGARFRVHGRDPASGLDCVGLAAWALRAAGCESQVPSGYALRSGDAVKVREAVAAAGLRAAEDVLPGDLLLLQAGPGQMHFAIQCETGMIHADAMLRRVVERPDVPWPVIGRWRVGGE